VLISFSPSRKPFVRFLSPAKGVMPNKTFQPFLLIPIILRIFAVRSDVARRRYGRKGSGIVFQQPVEIFASFF
jgi:hypothetical protein